MIPKTKRVRLSGRRLEELNEAIHERDGHRCIICGAYVHIGEKFHHEPPGIGKSDEIEKGVLLCYTCHQERHFGPDSQKIKQKAAVYLEKLYREDKAWKN